MNRPVFTSRLKKYDEEKHGPKGYLPPNFINISKAYGIKTMEINQNSEFEKKIDELLNIDAQTIFSFQLSRFASACLQHPRNRSLLHSHCMTH